ncbi:uncharacterized protein LOC123516635 [Portunus trituberculatus]|uniref:uncharacterized protein LOC123516635 n=1 Tax=Portunus trituberculatus TaxID=210409 RepID=UPI001E1CFC88|nr:uncharacterized protein LOC123516635 [Portunus trituberculatus]
MLRTPLFLWVVGVGLCVCVGVGVGVRAVVGGAIGYKQYKWAGQGEAFYIPRSVPRPRVIPRWNPLFDPTYTALWVPTTPTAAHAPVPHHAHVSNPSYGFGPPKGNDLAPTPIRQQPTATVKPAHASPPAHTPIKALGNGLEGVSSYSHL